LLLNVEEWYASSVVSVQTGQLERHHPLDIITTQNLNPITMMQVTILETKTIPDGISNNLGKDDGNI
jgi:ABC-type enterochelin transport system ATPase subunit